MNRTICQRIHFIRDGMNFDTKYSTHIRLLQFDELNIYSSHESSRFSIIITIKNSRITFLIVLASEARKSRVSRREEHSPA